MECWKKIISGREFLNRVKEAQRLGAGVAAGRISVNLEPLNPEPLNACKNSLREG